MAQYASANMPAEGAEFFSARLREFDPRLTDVQRALYLSAIGLLRAQHAPAVPLMHRIGWVKETYCHAGTSQATLRRASLRCELDCRHRSTPSFPGRFHQRKAAQEELDWCVKNVEKAPDAAWLREVYYQLAKLASAGGEPAKAQEYLRRSGYTDLKKADCAHHCFLGRRCVRACLFSAAPCRNRAGPGLRPLRF
jgi:hypothetical protein